MPTATADSRRPIGYAAKSTLIHAPVEAVWNALNDIDHTPEWVVGLENAVLNTSPPYGLGSEYTDYNRLGPFPQVTLWRVTEFEPMTRQVHVSESRVLPTTMILNLSPASDGALLEHVVEYRFLPSLGPVGRLLERLLMNRLLGQVLAQNHARLETYLARRADPGV